MPRATGQVTTSAQTQVPVEATAYTEPTSGAQRSLKSSSTNDAATGTGVRTVKLTYYRLASDGTVSGPFTETITLNGLTAVPLVNLDVCFVEKIEAVTAGSGGVAAGTISLYTDSAGLGSVIGSIATGAVRTLWAHHYVPSNAYCRVTDVEVAGGDTTSALVDIARTSYVAGIPTVEQPAVGPIGTTSTLPVSFPLADSPHAPIPGPARIRARVTPGSNTSQVTRASFGYVDVRSGAF